MKPISPNRSNTYLIALIVLVTLLPGCWIINWIKEKRSTDNQVVKTSTEIAIGDLVDKITILKIKTERITNPQKLMNIKKELTTLSETYQNISRPSSRLSQLEKDLKKANTILWETEDSIRDKEHKKEFDDSFVELARKIYFTNDKRCAIKREINNLLGSNLIEEKSYKEYGQSAYQI